MYSKSSHSGGAQNFHSLFSLPAGMSEQGPLLLGRCTKRVPSVGSWMKTAIGEGRGSTPTVETHPVRMCELAMCRKGCE